MIAEFVFILGIGFLLWGGVLFILYSIDEKIPIAFITGLVILVFSISLDYFFVDKLYRQRYKLIEYMLTHKCYNQKIYNENRDIFMDIIEKKGKDKALKNFLNQLKNKEVK